MGRIYQFPNMAKKLDNPPNRLREVRQAMRGGKGMTLKEVAERLGTTATVISRWEIGERPMYMDHLRNLARIYGTDVGQLLNPQDNLTSLSERERKVIEAMRFGPPNTADTMEAVAESALRFQHRPSEESDAG